MTPVTTYERTDIATKFPQRQQPITRVLLVEHLHHNAQRAAHNLDTKQDKEINMVKGITSQPHDQTRLKLQSRAHILEKYNADQSRIITRGLRFGEEHTPTQLLNRRF